jgi:hypothetical protein
MRVIWIAMMLLLSKVCLGQIDKISILVGKDEATITKYFDSLNSLRPNVYFKIKRSTTDDGNLDLSVEFALDDQVYFKCLNLTATFQRVRGTEYCTSQSIFGEIEYANFYLSFIKDNFTRVSDGIWEIPSSAIKGLKVVALYKKIEETHFGIILELREPDK